MSKPSFEDQYIQKFRKNSTITPTNWLKFMIKLQISVLAFDFDRTIIAMHTGGVLPIKSSCLLRCVRSVTDDFVAIVQLVGEKLNTAELEEQEKMSKDSEMWLPKTEQSQDARSDRTKKLVSLKKNTLSDKEETESDISQSTADKIANLGVQVLPVDAKFKAGSLERARLTLGLNVKPNTGETAIGRSPGDLSDRQGFRLAKLRQHIQQPYIPKDLSSPESPSDVSQGPSTSKQQPLIREKAMFVVKESLPDPKRIISQDKVENLSVDTECNIQDDIETIKNLGVVTKARKIFNKQVERNSPTAEQATKFSEIFKLAIVTFADDRIKHKGHLAGRELVETIWRNHPILKNYRVPFIVAYNPEYTEKMQEKVISEEQFKLKHLKDTGANFNVEKSSILLIDDDKKNCEQAVRCGYRSVNVIPSGFYFKNLKPL